ncbi:hypothetical protein FKM82_003388 [Ascaphus truei]
MSLLTSRNSFEAGDLEDACCGAMASACCITKEDSFDASVGTPGGNPSSLVTEETQGYDVDFDPPLESKYECPICLMALREAVQTPCGHRFCKGCITKSLRPCDERETCHLRLSVTSLDERTLATFTCLLPEHDQACPLAYVTCEYCETNLIREQMASHYEVDCVMAPIPCTYSPFGCPEKMQRNELARHLQEFTQAHMRMMAQTLRSVSTTMTPTTHLPNISFSDLSQFEPGPLSMHPPHPSLLSAQHDCSQETRNLRETVDQLEGRLVKQDHQIRELIAKMETQSSYVTDLKRTIRILEDKMAEVEAQQYNGVYVWKIENFSVHLKHQEEEKPVVIHSPGFYTGRPGYKLCLRLHIQLPSAQRCANYISLFVHTMQGEYDGLLPWPFQGTIRLCIMDQSEGPIKQNQEEVMDTKPDLLAFQRPTMQRNPKGFGYVTFMHLQALKQRQYIKNDTLLVRCAVTTHLDLSSLRREGFQPRSTDGVL